MKLEKITQRVGRRYADACGAAHGLDLVGERWALLVIRELVFGPRRFSDLKGDLCGISANVLTQRLEGLEASGIVRRRRLPPPAAVQVYELTDWGREIQPVFMVLGRWAARSPHHDPTLPLSGSSLMMSFMTMVLPGRAAANAMTVGFRFGQEDWRVEVGPDGVRPARVDAPGPADVVVTGAPEPVAAAVYGGVPLAQLEAAGALEIRGDRAAFTRFLTLFALPPKAEVPAQPPE
jgi:DNA-binding HxlR family transcriptional regulator